MPFLLPGQAKVYAYCICWSLACQFTVFTPIHWRRAMQGIPDNLLLDDPPLTVRQDTDTATPRTPIPIYLMHGGSIPFCENPRCFCQRGKHAATLLYEQIATGKLWLAQLAASVSVAVDLLSDVPESCQLFGRSWEHCELPGAKECRLCRIRGYCPHCVAMPPPNAQPFTCTRHAGREVQ